MGNGLVWYYHAHHVLYRAFTTGSLTMIIKNWDEKVEVSGNILLMYTEYRLVRFALQLAQIAIRWNKSETF